MGIDKIQIARKMLLDYLKEQIALKGITQDQLSQITGFTQSNISRMLSSKYSPSLDNFLKLCEAANVYVFIIDKEANEDTAQLMRERWGKINNN
jgi:transcriptional regulator with XRE-family HTH domain